MAKRRGIWGRLLSWVVRSTLANPEQWLSDWFGGGGRSATGLTINEVTALNFATVFAGVRILAEAVGSLPIITLEQVENSKRRATEHRNYTLLHDAPNPLMTAMTYEETVMGHLVLGGNHYSEIERDGGGRVMALWPLIPSRMTQITRPEVGRLIYWYQPETGPQVSLPMENVLHIRGFSPNGFVGYNTIRMAKESIALGMAAEQFAARFFSGDSMPRMALKAPGKVSKETNEMLKGSWKNIYGGLSNVGDIAILPEGLEPYQIGVNPEQAQMLATREFQVKEICRVLNIPPHMMGIMEKASYASIEQELLRFIQYSLRPWLVRIEQEMNFKLFAPSERGRFFVEHLVDAMLRADIGARYRAYKDAIYTGIMSPDQAAEKENLPTEGGDAAKKWFPVNYQPINRPPAASEPPPALEPPQVEGV